MSFQNTNILIACTPKENTLVELYVYGSSTGAIIDDTSNIITVLGRTYICTICVLLCFFSVLRTGVFERTKLRKRLAPNTFDRALISVAFCRRVECTSSVTKLSSVQNAPPALPPQCCSYCYGACIYATATALHTYPKHCVLRAASA